MKFLKYIILTIIILAGVFGYFTYSYIWGPNVPNSLDDDIVYIYEKESVESIVNRLYTEGKILNKVSFLKTAELMKYSDNAIKSGRYRIEAKLSNRALLSLLRSGKQQAVNITFNNIRTLEELAGKISAQIQLDSLELLNHITSEDVQTKYGFDKHTMMTMFIPNTYTLYWNTNLTSFTDRMKKEHDRFWDSNRTAKAQKIGLSKDEVYSLAAIVEKETLASSEKNRIAGLYLNRLQQGIKLQADPTVVYAVGDFNIRRVLNKHLETDSPYNTYMNTGLPPGPIYMPDISTIDAVLSPENHSYIFFCAKPDNSGLHDFSKTNAQHAAYARKYHRWLDNQRIYR